MSIRLSVARVKGIIQRGLADKHDEFSGVGTEKRLPSYLVLQRVELGIVNYSKIHQKFLFLNEYAAACGECAG